MGLSDEINACFGLSGKTAVVTGAATGIGREIARLFHAVGATLIGADNNLRDLASLPEQCPGAVTVAYDQSDPASIKALFAKADEVAAPIDILVNCAAIYPLCPFEEADTAFLDRMLAIDVRGPFQCTQEAVKRMKIDRRGGAIVNISSVNSLRALIYDNIHYGVAKAGINNLTISIALEYGEFNIRSNAILPGGVATEQAGKSVEGHSLRGPILQPGRIPLHGTSCDPRDIARTALFLASDASTFVTGQLIAVDGGFLIS